MYYSKISPKQRQLVCFVGGGGKSSIMSMLAKEAAREGRSVLATTTTKMLYSQLHYLGPLVMDPMPDKLKADLIRTARHHPLVTAATGTTTTPRGEKDQVIGLQPDLITAIYQDGPFDLIYVEADGAKGLPFKAPADHEPVIPQACTLICIVVGIDALGRPLTERFVHRPDKVAQITGRALGAMVNADMITAVFLYYKALATEISPHIDLLPIINKVDDTAERQKALPLVDTLIAAGFRRAIVASTVTGNPMFDVISA